MFGAMRYIRGVFIAELRENFKFYALATINQMQIFRRNINPRFFSHFPQRRLTGRFVLLQRPRDRLPECGIVAALEHKELIRIFSVDNNKNSIIIFTHGSIDKSSHDSRFLCLLFQLFLIDI